MYRITIPQMQDIADIMAGLQVADANRESREHPDLKWGDGGRATVVGPIPVITDAWGVGSEYTEVLGYIHQGEFGWEFTQAEPKTKEAAA